MAIWGTAQTRQQQLGHSPRFSVALGYLEKVQTPGTPEHQRVVAVPAGEMNRVDLAAGVFALEQAYIGKPRTERRFEAHNRPIDLPAIVVGPERMDVTARDDSTINENKLVDSDGCS